MAKEDAQKPEDGSQAPSMNTDITFPPIGEEEPPAEPASAPDPVQEQLAKMEARFEANQRAFEEERTRWQQTVDRLIQSQAAPAPAAPAPQEQPKGIYFGDLPDPVDKPEDFKRALAERFEKEISQRLSSTLDQYQQQTSQQQTSQQAFDAMWAKFQQDYSDLADKTTTLKGAIVSEREAMQARGLDPQQAILADPDGFMRRIATKMRDELGVTAPSVQDTEVPPPASTPGQGQQTANRTAGVGGGSTQNARGTGQPKPPPSFIEQLKKIQLDSGLI